MNYRHRMAQQAQRSSIELYTHLYFRGKTIEEEAYIIKIMANGIVALIPKYGIEGLIKWDDPKTLSDNGVVYNAEEGRFDRLATGETFMCLFQKVKIAITVEEIESSQRQKLVVKLVEPAIGKATSADGSEQRPPSPASSTSGTGQKRTFMEVEQSQ